MRLILKSVGILAPLLGASLVAGACSANGTGGGGAPLVIASTAILGDIVADVTGDVVDVETLMPRGADPHSFEPSARQAARLRDADLLIVNGLGLEEGLLDAVESARDDGVRVFEVAPAVDPLPIGQAPDDHEDEDEHADDEHAEGDLDPHVWMDPLRMDEGVGLIGEELFRIAPEVDWATRVAAYRGKIRDTHEQIQEILNRIPSERRKLVTDHDSLTYFAARYGFEVVGTVVPGTSTLGAPSARDLSRLAELIRTQEVSAIFVETSQDRRLADALAGEVGTDVEVVSLFAGTLGEPPSPAGTYLGMLMTDAQRIAEALS